MGYGGKSGHSTSEAERLIGLLELSHKTEHLYMHMLIINQYKTKLQKGKFKRLLQLHQRR